MAFIRSSRERQCNMVQPVEISEDIKSSILRQRRARTIAGSVTPVDVISVPVSRVWFRHLDAISCFQGYICGRLSTTALRLSRRGRHQVLLLVTPVMRGDENPTLLTWASGDLDVSPPTTTIRRSRDSRHLRLEHDGSHGALS
nr:hypothetical protein CFP56_21701 [Quercus suber]